MLKNSSWSKLFFLEETDQRKRLFKRFAVELDETNLANFGSELEREHRKAEGALETAWNYEGSPIGHEVYVIDINMHIQINNDLVIISII